MFQNFELDSGLSVIILDFSDTWFVSFKIYNVSRNLYEYSELTVNFRDIICFQKLLTALFQISILSFLYYR